MSMHADAALCTSLDRCMGACVVLVHVNAVNILVLMEPWSYTVTSRVPSLQSTILLELLALA